MPGQSGHVRNGIALAQPVERLGVEPLRRLGGIEPSIHVEAVEAAAEVALDDVAHSLLPTPKEGCAARCRAEQASHHRRQGFAPLRQETHRHEVSERTARNPGNRGQDVPNPPAPCQHKSCAVSALLACSSCHHHIVSKSVLSSATIHARTSRLGASNCIRRQAGVENRKARTVTSSPGPFAFLPL